MEIAAQKKMLTFLHKIEEWRKKEVELEKAMKGKESMKANRLSLDITLLKMAVDRELPDMIKCCKWTQLKLDL